MKSMSNKDMKITWLKGLISLALMGWLFYSLEIENVLLVLINMDLRWLAAATAWIVIAMVVSNIKWRLLMRVMGIELPWSYTWNSYWVGIFFNNFLPSSIGGDAMRIHLVGRKTGDLSGSTASVVVERILATGGLAALGLVAAPFIKSQNLTVTLLFIVLILISLALVLLIISPKFSKLMAVLLPIKNDRTKQFFSKFSDCGRQVKEQPKVILQVAIWSAAFQFCVVMVNFYIFRALKMEPVSLLEAAYLIPAASVAAMIPISINGYGVRENAYVLLLSLLNVSKASAVTASVLFAFLVSILSLYGGWVWFKGLGNGRHMA